MNTALAATFGAKKFSLIAFAISVLVDLFIVGVGYRYNIVRALRAGISSGYGRTKYSPADFFEVLVVYLRNNLTCEF